MMTKLNAPDNLRGNKLPEHNGPRKKTNRLDGYPAQTPPQMAEGFCLLEFLSEQINIRLYVFLKGCDFFVNGNLHHLVVLKS